MSEYIKHDFPYFQAPNRIFEIGLDPFELSVFLYLYRCANNSTAYPGYKTMAKKTGMSERKAKEIVKLLVDNKYIMKVKRCGYRGDESNIYDINNINDFEVIKRKEKTKKKVKKVDTKAV